MAKGKPFPFAAKGGKSKPAGKPTQIGKGVPAPPLPFNKGGRTK
jgi:hypothetical protein